MWKTYSLRTRLSLFLCAMFLAALVAGAILLHFFAAGQLVDENEPAARSAVLVAGALNNALKASPEPNATLDAFAAGLTSANPDAIQFRRAEVSAPTPPGKAAPATGLTRVPPWFVTFLALPELSRHIPIMIEGQRVGDLVFEPDITADIYEKWIGFLSIVASGIGLAVFTVVIAFWTVEAALKPLQDLGNGLARLRAGQYSEKISCSGPPEIRRSCIAVNELASTLSDLNSENRILLRRMVSVQDEERRDISRELHDELGPLLFAIRANVVAMVDSGKLSEDEPNSAPQRVMQSVEALQIANRRILDRLRPLYIEELGLQSSVRKLLRDVHVQLPELDVGFEIDPELVTVDSIVTQTVYRVLQEGVTNVLKHARASEMRIKAALHNGSVLVEVSDNGIGWSTEPVFGRGLTGMRERLRALAGTFEVSRRDGWTTVRCSLPSSSIALT
jgi:two-component system sensor histidine kinase UhpB